jgi:hypothetical protein
MVMPCGKRNSPGPVPGVPYCRTRLPPRAQKGATERSINKADVIPMMKRAEGVTLAEIMETTSWQAHTVRGFVSILGSKGGEKVESSKNAGERRYHIVK